MNHWLNKCHFGDCLETLRLMPENSVDSIVTDPPYGLSFMGKKWDYDVPSVEIWAECLRVLKPGGHLLAFAGTRTQHRMAVRIEDAGFEIRDMIAWVYGSGFPKSLDVSKALDKAAGAEREVVGLSKGKGGENLNNLVRDGGNDAIDAKGCGAYGIGAKQITIDIPITAPATEAARQWQGWGTALKPALEPITLARKPLGKGMTVAANVLEHGTGALNIDGCRVGDDRIEKGRAGRSVCESNAFGKLRGTAEQEWQVGRWPANLIHDGSDEVVAQFPAQAGASAPVKGTEESRASVGRVTGERERVAGAFHGDTGSAARFFYCAKASKADREEGLDGAPDRVLAMSNQAKAELARGNMHEGESGMNTAKVRKNHHPTVKPTDLMAYLCRLVTPPGGVVLDPFMGSGSTGCAAVLEGFQFVGMERDADYIELARARIESAKRQGYQPSLLLEAV